jgi:hypothetical protein
MVAMSAVMSVCNPKVCAGVIRKLGFEFRDMLGVNC